MIEVILLEVTKGNFSFFILVIGILQLIVGFLQLCVMWRRR